MDSHKEKDMLPEVVTVNGHEYRPAETEGERLRLVLVDNGGLLYVGRCDVSGYSAGAFFRIRDARCVIKWGTSEHIAQLAEDGPSNGETLLGRAGDVNIAPDRVVLYYDVNEDAWKGKI